MPENSAALVTADWVQEHRNDDGVVIAEVDEDARAYAKDHIPDAIGFDWQADFQAQDRRGFLDKAGFEALMDAKGITPDDHVVLYGGNNNWFAAYAYWYFKLYGHDRVSLMDGGRKLWELQGRELASEATSRTPGSGYRASEAKNDIRAIRDQILSSYVGAPEGTALVDVRSPAEFSGEASAPEHLPQENAYFRGHIPGAANISWGKAVNADTGEFLATDELKSLYEGAGVTPDKDVVAYCRIGERSAHTWFVLHEILGYDRVRNYDGSWTEYGSLVDVPVAKGA